MDHLGPGESSNEDLYRRHLRRVVAYFERRGCSREESRDLAQETFLRVYKSMETFRGESSEVTWILQIAANLFKNTLRSQSTKKREGQEVALEGAGGDLGDERAASRGGRQNGPLEEILTEERSQRLREALEELPPQMRQAVLLRVDGDLKYREIAVLMSVSIETVKAHLYQARQHLRTRLADYFTTERE